MSGLEDRLRDAIRGATDTVPPAAAENVEQAIRQRIGQARPSRRRPLRVLTPIAAAAAVAAIAVLAAVLAPFTPRAHQTGLGSASATDPKFMIVINSYYSLQVRDFGTGAVVNRILIPRVPDFCHHSECGRHFTWVTTNNGRNYLVGISRFTPCRSWLYTFTLNSNGKPSALTPFAALPTLAEADITNLAISGNGRYLAFAAGGSAGCPLRNPAISALRISWPDARGSGPSRAPTKSAPCRSTPTAGSSCTTCGLEHRNSGSFQPTRRQGPLQTGAGR